MITISLFIFLMILSVLAKALAMFLGIPELTELTNMMHSLTMLVVAIKYTGLGIAFLFQQYERSRDANNVCA